MSKLDIEFEKELEKYKKECMDLYDKYHKWTIWNKLNSIMK